MDLLSENINVSDNRKIPPRTNIYLSLYLVIFGFFVVLVNESQLDAAKTQDAISSVKQSFFANAQSGVAEDFQVNDVSHAQNADFQETKKTVSEFLPQAKFFVNASQNELRIELAADTLFFQNTAAVRGDARAAMNALAALLSRREGGETIFVTVPRQTDQTNDVGVVAADMRRAHLIAEIFTSNRTEASSVLTGYGRQKAGSVSITIQTRGNQQRPVLQGG